jgi:hypothetical protein
MDKSAVSLHTPESKQQSKLWIKKGQLGPVQAKVHASGIIKMILVFSDKQGAI